MQALFKFCTITCAHIRFDFLIHFQRIQLPITVSLERIMTQLPFNSKVIIIMNNDNIFGTCVFNLNSFSGFRGVSGGFGSQLV